MRALRTTTFQNPGEHSEPIVKELEVLTKLTDLNSRIIITINFFFLPLRIYFKQ